MMKMEVTKGSNDPVDTFSPTQKEKIIQKIKVANLAHVQDALITVAKNHCRFPEPLNKKLAPLQLAYREHHTNEDVKKHIEKAIVSYIETDGYKEFRLLLDVSFDEKNWNTGFVSLLAQNLKILTEEEPLVEAAIKEGKIYWRMMKGKEVLYSRPESTGKKFDFNQSNSWRMTWEQFRIFKDSGKRSGSVEITLKRFLSQFLDDFHIHATDIWEELKYKGFLNSRNRLSQGWRVISGNTLLDSLIIISEDDVLSILTALKGKNGTATISESDFINSWKVGQQCRAKLIWNDLKKKGVINEKHKLQKLSVILSQKTLLDYSQIEEALYSVANNEENKEVLNVLASASIYRPERSVKTWRNTGLIQNKDPTNSSHCTKLWDVNIYNDLKNHRNTSDERLLNKNNKLNYDHIPSVDILEARSQELLKHYTHLETSCYAQLFPTGYLTRQNETKISSEKSKEIQQNLTQAQEFKQQIESESKIDSKGKNKKKHGPLWWSIAIPEALHDQGSTFMKSSKEQRSIAEHPFVYDLRTYLDILETRAEEFSLSFDDYLKALGAFRYLYRCQEKIPFRIAGKITIGITPQTFFNQADDKKKIDQLFEERIKRFLQKREGLHEVRFGTKLK